MMDLRPQSPGTLTDARTVQSMLDVRWSDRADQALYYASPWPQPGLLLG